MEAEERRQEAERVERESASAELSAAIEVAKSSRAFDGLSKPLRRCKRAVDVDPTLIEAGEALKLELEEEKRENERLARLEAEKVEREGATEELAAAVAAATESRDAGALSKPIRRAKKAVDFEPQSLYDAEKLEAELKEEKKEADRTAKEAAAAAKAAAKEGSVDAD